MHEKGRGIGETEGHGGIFIKTVPNIFLLDFELVISGSQINFGEYFCPTKLIKQIINPWKWIFVLDDDIIYQSIVHTHPKIVVLLIHEYCG